MAFSEILYASDAGVSEGKSDDGYSRDLDFVTVSLEDENNKSLKVLLETSTEPKEKFKDICHIFNKMNINDNSSYRHCMLNSIYRVSQSLRYELFLRVQDFSKKLNVISVADLKGLFCLLETTEDLEINALIALAEKYEDYLLAYEHENLLNLVVALADISTVQRKTLIRFVRDSNLIMDDRSNVSVLMKIFSKMPPDRRDLLVKLITEDDTKLIMEDRSNASEIISFLRFIKTEALEDFIKMIKTGRTRIVTDDCSNAVDIIAYLRQIRSPAEQFEILTALKARGTRLIRSDNTNATEVLSALIDIPTHKDRIELIELFSDSKHFLLSKECHHAEKIISCLARIHPSKRYEFVRFFSKNLITKDKKNVTNSVLILSENYELEKPESFESLIDFLNMIRRPPYRLVSEDRKNFIHILLYLADETYKERTLLVKLLTAPSLGLVKKDFSNSIEILKALDASPKAERYQRLLRSFLFLRRTPLDQRSERFVKIMNTPLKQKIPAIKGDVYQDNPIEEILIDAHPRTYKEYAASGGGASESKGDESEGGVSESKGDEEDGLSKSREKSLQNIFEEIHQDEIDADTNTFIRAVFNHKGVFAYTPGHIAYALRLGVNGHYKLAILADEFDFPDAFPIDDYLKQYERYDRLEWDQTLAPKKSCLSKLLCC